MNAESLTHAIAAQRDTYADWADCSAVERLRVATASSSDQCILWQGFRDPKGYGKVWFESSYKLAHRVSYAVNVADIPGGVCVCHRCDNPSCINPRHLFLGTHAENIRDCTTKKRNAFGTKHSRAKLTDTDIVAIRSNTASTRQIAKAYGIAHSRVSEIKNLKSWRHISEEGNS